MAKYSYEFKKQVVNEYLSGKGGSTSGGNEEPQKLVADGS